MAATVVITTFENETDARNISRKIVQDGVAACASIIPVHSIYVWDGSIQDSPECMVIFKTTSDNGKRLCQAIGDCHPYTTPEILRLDTDHVSHPYMRWLSDSVH